MCSEIMYKFISFNLKNITRERGGREREGSYIEERRKEEKYRGERERYNYRCTSFIIKCSISKCVIFSSFDKLK